MDLPPMPRSTQTIMQHRLHLAECMVTSADDEEARQARDQLENDLFAKVVVDDRQVLDMFSRWDDQRTVTVPHPLLAPNSLELMGADTAAAGGSSGRPTAQESLEAQISAAMSLLSMEQRAASVHFRQLRAHQQRSGPRWGGDDEADREEGVLLEGSLLSDRSPSAIARSPPLHAKRSTSRSPRVTRSALLRLNRANGGLASSSSPTTNNPSATGKPRVGADPSLAAPQRVLDFPFDSPNRSSYNKHALVSPSQKAAMGDSASNDGPDDGAYTANAATQRAEASLLRWTSNHSNNHHHNTGPHNSPIGGPRPKLGGFAQFRSYEIEREEWRKHYHNDTSEKGALEDGGGERGGRRIRSSSRRGGGGGIRKGSTSPPKQQQQQHRSGIAVKQQQQQQPTTRTTTKTLTLHQSATKTDTKSPTRTKPDPEDDVAKRKKKDDCLVVAEERRQTHRLQSTTTPKVEGEALDTGTVMGVGTRAAEEEEAAQFSVAADSSSSSASSATVVDTAVENARQLASRYFATRGEKYVPTP